ncbi:MAG: hypothetical protein FH756_10945 [Firmicutes bacterium]|nr:hypothetical protein [Bacillota bacterium]
MREIPNTQGFFGGGGIDEYNAPILLDYIEREMEEDENDWEFAPAKGVLGYIVTLIPLLITLLYKIVSGIFFLVSAQKVSPPKNLQTFRIRPDYERVHDQPGYVKTESGILIPGDYNVQ